MKRNTEELIKEFQFKASRSGGSGGQHINKVSSKIELLWHIESSAIFTSEEKDRIISKLKHRINKEGFFQLFSEEDRSQLNNKQNAVEKAIALISESLKIEKPRKATKPSKTSVKKRLEEKRKQALKKINRNGKWDF